MTYEYRGNTLDKSGWNSSGPAAAARATRERRRTSRERTTRTSGGRTPARILAAIFGPVFRLVGRRKDPVANR